ncbi:hypothetical protein V1477_020443 [Vespula maculifrons]|uniref:Uncharacterized protein n=1 Tax=Vespula maculifrons TaxID=7453 RepID=A0ABD2ALX6_VESMC
MNLKINLIEDCSLHRAATYQGNVASRYERRRETRVENCRRESSLEERSHGNGIPRAKFELHLPANRGIMFYDSVRLLPDLKEVRQKEETKRDGESLPSKDSNTD